MNTDLNSLRKSSRPLLLGLSILLIVSATWLICRPSKPDHSGSTQKSVSAQPKNSAEANAPDSGNLQPTAHPDKPLVPVKPSNDSPDGPTVTRANRDRDSVVTPSGIRKSVIDPMASWADLPPWPEGPRLYAEIETLSKRYINLRPDDLGVLPRVLTSPGERLEIKITIPEAEAGEKIHVELPNGGAFTDSKVGGRIYDVQPGHSFSFAVFADDARGNCNVKLRHRGHTRSISLWVGEPEESGS